MPSRKEKLAAHAEHVLDQFIGLRGKFAVLEPMLFDTVVAGVWGNGKKAQAFATLRNTMVNGCVLDIVNIALDRDERTPNVGKLVAALDDVALIAELREEFAIWKLPPTGVSDPAILRLLRAGEQREEAERSKKFDEFVEAARTGWKELCASPALSSFGTMRDKLIAHSELWHDQGQYRPRDVSTLGLKFGDLGTTIERLEPLVDRLTLIYRNSSYDFATLKAQLLHGRDAFWSGQRPRA